MTKKKVLLIAFLSISTIIGGIGVTSCGTTSSNSSLSSEVDKYYNVTIIDNKDATISVDKQTAKKDETVIITVNVINEKKLIKEVKVNDLIVSKVDDNHYSFIMPEKDVTISVILENKPLENKLITINADENILSYSLKIKDQEISEAKEGEIVTLFCI